LWTCWRVLGVASGTWKISAEPYLLCSTNQQVVVIYRPPEQDEALGFGWRVGSTK
jgi:hypothetical protein